LTAWADVFAKPDGATANDEAASLISSPSCERAASTGDSWGGPRRARTLVTPSRLGSSVPCVAPWRSSRPGRRSRLL